MMQTLRQFFALVRTQLFRLFTTALVLTLCVYLWFEKPEHLKSWSRGVRRAVEWGCEQLPQPWDARIEPLAFALIGPWAQIALAIFIARFTLATPFATQRFVKGWRWPRSKKTMETAPKK